MSKGQTVKVAAGDTIASLAFRYGHVWKTIWDAKENKDLRKLRDDPSCLAPGDVVFIPKLRDKQVAAAIDAAHQFRRKGVPSIVRIQFFAPPERRRPDEERKRLRSAAHRRLLIEHPAENKGPLPKLEGEETKRKPWQQILYRLVVNGVEKTGKTDKDGVLREPVPPDARRGTLVLAEGSEHERRLTLALGELAPFDSQEGVFQRLTNMAYYAGEEPEDLSQAIGQEALRAFQRAYNIEPSGKPDAETMTAIRDAHGR